MKIEIMERYIIERYIEIFCGALFIKILLGDMYAHYLEI